MYRITIVLIDTPAFSVNIEQKSEAEITALRLVQSGYYVQRGAIKHYYPAHRIKEIRLEEIK